jgi:hypothetical protein
LHAIKTKAWCFCCLQVARLLLYKEYWYGTAESTSGLTRKSKHQQQAAASADAAAPSSSSSSSSSSDSETAGVSAGYVLQLLPSHKFDVPVTDLQRPQPQQLAGSWNVFLVAANPIVEENPDTLQVRGCHVQREISNKGLQSPSQVVGSNCSVNT